MKSPRAVARAYYVIFLDVRTNMAASMASQAAVRGLRAATSKHILLDKLKVPLAFTLQRAGDPCLICLQDRMYVVVALGNFYCSYMANRFSLTDRLYQWVYSPAASILWFAV